MSQIIVWRHGANEARDAILEAIEKIEAADADDPDVKRVHVVLPVAADVEVLPEIYRVSGA